MKRASEKLNGGSKVYKSELVTTTELNKTANQLAKSERKAQNSLQNQISQLKSSLAQTKQSVNQTLNNSNLVSGISRRQRREMKRSQNPYLSNPAYSLYQSQYRPPDYALKSILNSNDRVPPLFRGVADQNSTTMNAEDPMDPASRNNRRKAPISEGTYTTEAKSVSDMLSAWDKFTINRAFPGMCVSPYVNNMTILPLPTGTFKTSIAIANCYSTATASSVPLGTNTYTVLMFCPSLSSYLGPGTVGYLGATTRVSGMLVYQANSLSSTMVPNSFTDINVALPASSLYGSDFTSIGTGGYVWACSSHLRLITPQANLVGSCYKGMVTLAQLGPGLTIQNLIQDAVVTSTGAYENTLRSSVSDPALVMDINANSTTSGSGSRAFPECENEVVSYIVYQTPAISVTTGSTTPFTLICNLEGNFVYYPKATDPIAFNIGQDEAKPTTQDSNLRHSVVSQTMSNLNTKDVADSGVFKSVWNNVSGWLGSVLPKAIGSGAKWLDNRFTGGAVQSFDNNILGGSLQHSLGLKTAQEEQADDFLRQLHELKVTTPFTASRASSMFSGGTANMQSSVHSRHIPTVSNGLVPKADFVYWFRQLDEVMRRRRGTTGQVIFLDTVATWLENEMEWFESQPDWVDEDHLLTHYHQIDGSPDKRPKIKLTYNQLDNGTECQEPVKDVAAEIPNSNLDQLIQDRLDLLEYQIRKSAIPDIRKPSQDNHRSRVGVPGVTEFTKQNVDTPCPPSRLLGRSDDPSFERFE